MYRRIFYLMLVVMIVSSACTLFSGGPTAPTATEVQIQPTTVKPAESTPTEKPAVATKPAKLPTATTQVEANTPSAPQGEVANLEDVKIATVQVIAEGSFVDPSFNVHLNAGKAGSGFIFDPSGLAITNNHVVTGAALLKVFVGGDTSHAYSAKVVGVSECSDLAVIQLDGSNFPYLQWAAAIPKVGEDVYAAGYPLGDPEFTLTRGIVSKAAAHPYMSRTSVDNVIEHDATIKPGSSGSPLVDKNGQVVGINYAGSDTGPYYAITKAEADKVLKTLMSGKDVTSLGINGEAFITDDKSLSGIWVYSVKSGSPADKAGITGGDIVTSLEDVILGTDGTMNDYCSILRSHQATDTLNVTILRFATKEVLSGQINGRALAVSQSFANDLKGQVNQDTGSTNTSTYTQYTTVTDDSTSIQTEVPAEWTDVDGATWNTTWGSQNISAPAIYAAANLDNFKNSWDESGVFATASSDLGKTGGYIELLDGVKGWFDKDCKLDSTQDFSSDVYEGKYQFWKDCGTNKSVAMVVVARPKQNKTSYLVLMYVIITKQADLDALDHILGNFTVKGSV